MKNILTKQLHISDLFSSLQREIDFLTKALKILILLTIGLIPLILQAHNSTVVSPLLTRIRPLGTGFKGDVFTYYKMIGLITLAILALLLFIRFIKITNLLSLNMAHLFAGVFAICIMLSTLLSETIHIALYGMFDRHDGALSYLSVLILFFIASSLTYSREFVYKIGYSLYPFVFINFILITINHYGYDALQFNGVRNLLTLGKESNNLGEGSFVLGTLNQWNFLSGTFSMMTVFFLALMIIDKTFWRKIVHAVIAAISLWVMLLSLSTSGSLTLVLLVPILIYLIIKLPKTRQQSISIGLFLVLAVSSFLFLTSQNERVYTESVGLFVKEDLQISSLIALPGKVINLLTAKEEYKEDTLLPELPDREISGGSGRVYIWIKTLRLVPEKPWIGYGMDTLLYNFPHFSIDARSGIRSETVLVDKPHNMYIGFLYGIGFVGFIGFLGLFTIILINSSKKLKVNDYLIAPLFLITLAFLFQGIFNDTLPGMTAIAYPILGILVSITKNSDISSKDTLSN